MRSEQAEEILGALYALSAGVLNDDIEGLAVLASEFDDDWLETLPTATLAVISSCVINTTENGTADNGLANLRLPSFLAGPLREVLAGRPTEVVARPGTDIVAACSRAVADAWLWASGGDREKALEIAHDHCRLLAKRRIH